jgi:hypothetical protein
MAGSPSMPSPLILCSQLISLSAGSGMYDNGPRYSPNASSGGGRGGPGMDKGFGGMQGPPKGKRGEMDRECKYRLLEHTVTYLTDVPDNRFAGTRMEELAGEIASLCKDQHGCRYLQKKLEEGSAEHRDMIFRETFGHFADLMTG